jgi:hypothetical protein
MHSDVLQELRLSFYAESSGRSNETSRRTQRLEIDPRYGFDGLGRRPKDLDLIRRDGVSELSLGLPF